MANTTNGCIQFYSFSSSITWFNVVYPCCCKSSFYKNKISLSCKCSSYYTADSECCLLVLHKSTCMHSIGCHYYDSCIIQFIKLEKINAIHGHQRRMHKHNSFPGKHSQENNLVNLLLHTFLYNAYSILRNSHDYFYYYNYSYSCIYRKAYTASIAEHNINKLASLNLHACRYCRNLIRYSATV